MLLAFRVVWRSDHRGARQRVGLFGALLRVEGSSTAQLHNNQPSGVPRGQRSQEDTAPLLRNHNQDDDGDKNKNKSKSMTTT